MTEKRLLEVCKALFEYSLHECYDTQCERDLVDEIGLSYEEYVQLGGRLTKQELSNAEPSSFTSLDKALGLDGDEDAQMYFVN